MYVDQIDYFKDRYDNESHLNLDLSVEGLTTNDFIEYTITDAEKFRPDTLAARFYGNSGLYFMILHFNRIKRVEELDSGKTIRIPSITYIRTNYNRIKREVL